MNADNTMNDGIPPDAEPKWNRDEAERFLQVMHGRRGTFEVRILKSREAGRGEPRNWTGFFRDAKSAADAIDEFWRTHEGGHAYVTINPLDDKLYDRSPGKFSSGGDASKDEDVTRRNWLYIDLDPVRPTGVSATSDEKAKAWGVTTKVKAWLSGQGWPDPIVVDSGNGYHLHYRCDIGPANDLHRQVLQVLGEEFGLKKRGDPVDVDQTVHNASRIAKIPGIISRKGESTPERPHRGSRVIHMPERIEEVPHDKIMLIAGITYSSRDQAKMETAPANARFAPPEQRKIQSALAAIDPVKVDYDLWLRIGMALRSWDEEKGLLIWHQWSERDSERYQPQVLDDKWRSFGESRDDGVTLGTLFHLAEESGWSKYAFLFPEEPPSALEEVVEEPPFPKESLPPELVAYAEDIAREFGYEAGPVAASMLMVASVLACDKWVVEVKPGWVEPLVLWLVKVAGSGEKKTPEFRAIMSPVDRDVERRTDDHEEKMRDFKSLKKVVEKRASAVLADKSVKNDDAKEMLSALDEELGSPPPDPHYVVSNLTTQAVEVWAGRTANKAGIAKVAIMTDEGGQFVNAVTGFHSEGRTANEFILKGYDLTGDSRIRVGDGSGRVRHPAIPVLTYIQPRRLWAALESHGDELQDQGLIPRCMLIIMRRTPTGWREESIDTSRRMAYEALMEPLAITEPMEEAMDGEMPFRRITLSPEAMAVMAEHYTWADFHASKIGDMKAWWNKFAGRTARIAGLLHLMAGLDERTPIHEDMMVRAVRLMNWFAVKNEQAMLDIKTESREGLLARIVRHVMEKDAKTFTARDVLLWTRGCMEVESMEDIRPALTRLEDLGYIARLDDKFGRGRPSEKYAANPVLFSGVMNNEPMKRTVELSPAGNGQIGAWPARPMDLGVRTAKEEALWGVEDSAGADGEDWLTG